jgi:hypothetical protein
MPDLQEVTCTRAVYLHGTVSLRRVPVPMLAALLLSLAACTNQSAVSPASEPLSVADNPGAVGAVGR